MSGADLAEWEAFEHLHGPILIHERLDVLQAMVSYVVARSAGAKDVSPRDFLPRWDADGTRRDKDAAIVRTLLGMRRSDGN